MGYHLIEGIEGDVVTHSPLGCFLLFLSIVFHPVQAFETCRDEIAAHIGEVDITAIEIGGVIALFSQRTGYAGQLPALRGHLHDGRGGKRGKTTPRAEGATICAP